MGDMGGPSVAGSTRQQSLVPLRVPSAHLLEMGLGKGIGPTVHTGVPAAFLLPLNLLGGGHPSHTSPPVMHRHPILACPKHPMLSVSPAGPHPPSAAKVSRRSSLSMKPSRFWSMMVKAWQRWGNEHPRLSPLPPRAQGSTQPQAWHAPPPPPL